MGQVFETSAGAAPQFLGGCVRGLLLRCAALQAHGQVASLLEAEYSAEEAAQVPLMQPDQLGAVLDALV